MGPEKWRKAEAGCANAVPPPALERRAPLPPLMPPLCRPSPPARPLSADAGGRRNGDG